MQDVMVEPGEKGPTNDEISIGKGKVIQVEIEYHEAKNSKQP
jgi:hypothetical protein